MAERRSWDAPELIEYYEKASQRLELSMESKNN